MVHSFSGSFSGIPASIVLDASSPTSIVSTSFVLSRNIPRTLHMNNGVSSISASGPLVLPTSGGWYRSVSALPVQYMRTFDVLLGLDWIEACGVRLGSTVVVDHDSAFSLPSWCTWEHSPLGTSSFSLWLCLVDRPHVQLSRRLAHVRSRQTQPPMRPPLTTGVNRRPPVAWGVVPWPAALVDLPMI